MPLEEQKRALKKVFSSLMSCEVDVIKSQLEKLVQRMQSDCDGTGEQAIHSLVPRLSAKDELCEGGGGVHDYGSINELTDTYEASLFKIH